jgi:hypothetical protein
MCNETLLQQKNAQACSLVIQDANLPVSSNVEKNITLVLNSCLVYPIYKVKILATHYNSVGRNNGTET